MSYVNCISVKLEKRKAVSLNPSWGRAGWCAREVWPLGTERLCRESLRLGAGDEERGPCWRDLGGHRRRRREGNRWQHSLPHPGREGRAPSPSLPLEATSLLLAPAPADSGLGELAVCPLALGSQLQAVHGISILSAPSGLTGILCFEAAESRESA